MENNYEDFLVQLGKYDTFDVVKAYDTFSNFGNIKSNYMYDLVSLRIMICELFYNAVKLFPDISEYTITCKNEITTTDIVIGKLTCKDEENECSYCYLGNDITTYIMNKEEVFYMYTANRVFEPNYDFINTVIGLIVLNGKYFPKITTSFINKPSSYKIK